MHLLVLATLVASDGIAPSTGSIPASPPPMVPLASDSVVGFPIPAKRPREAPTPLAPPSLPIDPPRDSTPSSTRWEDGIDPSQGLHARLGILVFAHGAGIQLGGLVRKGWMAGGLDGWIRPGAWPREVQLSPGRRARYHELLYGLAPWLAVEIPLGVPDGEGRRWSIAPFASFDLVGGTWYGTSRNPTGDNSPSLGLRIATAGPLALGLRRSFGQNDLAGAWKGGLTCEF